jgi:dihydrofolate reductase
MRKVIAAINMTVDGYCDHTAGIPDEDIHDHYSDLLRSADVILYGRTTFQLMEYWREVLKKPTGNKAFDDFAVTIDRIPKVVFSHSLKTIDWQSARLSSNELEIEVLELKGQPGGDILVGSPGLIVSLTKVGLIDEYQLCIHPVIIGSGLPLFKDIDHRINLYLKGSKTFGCGAVILYYVRK